MIDHGADIDAMDVDSWTPVHYACAKGHLDIIELIYSKATSLFQTIFLMTTTNNGTCLHLAVESGNISLVKYILTKLTKDSIKLLINQLSEPYGTPLHIAGKIQSTHSHKSILKFLF